MKHFKHSDAQIITLHALFSRSQIGISSNDHLLGNLPDRCRPEGLAGLCEEATTHHYRYPIDKLSRWLGFTQGVLTAAGVPRVSEDREFNHCADLQFEHTAAQVTALQTLFSRYHVRIVDNTHLLANLSEACCPENLKALCVQAIDHHHRYPFDKLNRWLGFVQGVLAAVRIIDVDEERDFSRPLLHAFHDQAPPTFAS